MSDAKPRRLPGRPRATEVGVNLSTYVSAREYDALYAMAKRRDESLSKTVRELLRDRLATSGDSPDR